jgi:hypothetical protein
MHAYFLVHFAHVLELRNKEAIIPLIPFSLSEFSDETGMVAIIIGKRESCWITYCNPYNEIIILCNHQEHRDLLPGVALIIFLKSMALLGHYTTYLRPWVFLK